MKKSGRQINLRLGSPELAEEHHVKRTNKKQNQRIVRRKLKAISQSRIKEATHD